MPSRVTIFNHFGMPIAELNTATTRSWILDGYGRCQFKLASFTDPNCNEQTLQYGNLVMVEHLPTRNEFGNAHGQLPNWYGIIVPPREWDYGLVTVTAYSAEHILKYRPMPYVGFGGTVGGLFTQILQYGLAFGGFPIQIGSVYANSAYTWEALRLSAYDEIANLTSNFGEDFDVTGVKSPNNQLTLYGNLYSQKGSVVNNLLSEGVGGNMKLPKLVEQGTLSNHTFGYNVSNSKGKQINSVSIDQASVGDYNRLGSSQNFTGDTQAAVDATTQAYTNQNSRPIFTLDLVALDVGNTFTDLSVGNIWNVVLKTVGFYGGAIGFQGPVRILGVEYDDLLNEAKLTTQVLTSGLTEANYA